MITDPDYLPGASEEDIARVQHNEPVEGAPQSPASISPATNDPNPTTGQVANDGALTAVRVDALEKELAEMKEKINAFFLANYRTSGYAV